MYETLKIFFNNNGIELFIISHKTKTPYQGPKYNLHDAASNWLEKNLFFEKNWNKYSKRKCLF